MLEIKREYAHWNIFIFSAGNGVPDCVQASSMVLPGTEQYCDVRRCVSMMGRSRWSMMRVTIL